MSKVLSVDLEIIIYKVILNLLSSTHRLLSPDYVNYSSQEPVSVYLICKHIPTGRKRTIENQSR